LKPIAVVVAVAPCGPASYTAFDAETVVVVTRPVTVTTNVEVEEFPDASLEVHVTVVAPTGNTLPDAGVQEVAGALSTMSAAVAAKVTVAPLEDVATTCIGEGVVRTGGTVSTTPSGNPPGV